MTRNITALIGFVLLAGCSGGGGDSSTTSTAPPPPTPTAQPDMLTATSQGILRGKANGQGQREILHAPNLLQGQVFVDQGNIVYPRTSNAGDIWTVRTDGTGDHALLNTAHSERAHAVSWPWVICTDDDEGVVKSLNTDTHAEFPIKNAGDGFIDIHKNRVIITHFSLIFSETFTGTDTITYVIGDQQHEIPRAPIVGDMLVYQRIIDDGLRPPVTFTANLFAVPFIGGTTIPLESGQFYVSVVAASIGARVVYHRCPFVSGQNIGPCDVVSVQNNGTSPVVLTTHPANEAVQGIVGNQVVIRRNLSGNDQLIAVPVTGGSERLLMTMNDNEFVQLTTDDLIVVTRPSGTWSLDLNGTLTKLGTLVGEYPFIAVGDSVCMTKGTAVWCMPLDGAGPQVKIADDGRVVGVL